MRTPKSSLLHSLLLLLGVALWLPIGEAHARGGRFSGPAGAPPAAPADAAEPAEGGAGHADGGCPMPPAGKAPEVENESGVPKDLFGGRTRPAGSARAPGLGDWIYWYDVNREEYEDLRRGTYVTERNPLFAMGGALGKRAGRVERRLDDTKRAALTGALREVLEGKSGKHWRYTHGAAYIALGKVATTGHEIELITGALKKEANVSQFARESAALGLGQLRRSEPRRQLPATSLRPVRHVLLRVFQDKTYAARTRAFAAISLGLLSDQPAVDERRHKQVAEALVHTWLRRDLDDEIQIGALLGLSLFAPDDVPAIGRIALHACVRRGNLKARSWSPLVRAHAALALGRIGHKGDAAVLSEQLRDRGASSPALTLAVVIGAGALGERLPGARADLLEAVLAARRQAKDPATRRLALMGLARMLAREPARGGDPVLGPVKALRAAAETGHAGDRAFGALALGVTMRAVDESVSNVVWQAQRGRAVEALRAGLADRGLDGHTRAAFATALGLAKDKSSTKALLAELENRDADPDLRAHAALALGLLGQARMDVIRGLVRALSEARSDQLRMRTVTALGLLGGGTEKFRDHAIRVLLEQLKRTRNQKVKGQIAITLARIGDARAVRPLIRMLAANTEQHLNRSIACAALGLMGDEERTPVLSAARRDSHYMGGSSVVYEVLDVL